MSGLVRDNRHPGHSTRDLRVSRAARYFFLAAGFFAAAFLAGAAAFLAAGFFAAVAITDHHPSGIESTSPLPVAYRLPASLKSRKFVEKIMIS